MDTAVCLFLLVCIFKHGEGWGGREGWRGGSRQRRRVSLSSGQEKKKNFYFLPGVSLCRKARLLPYLGIHSSSYPSCAVILRRLSFYSSFFFSPFLSYVARLVPANPSVLNSSFYCSVWSFWLAGCRVTMSVGKQSLSRMPRSLWQSNSPMKPYQ